MTADLEELGRSVVTKLRRPARLIAVAVIALALLIPLLMVQSVVHERHERYRGVVSDIAGSWSGDQRLAGPLLVVPYTVRVEVVSDSRSSQSADGVEPRWTTGRRRAVLLPQLLEIEGSVVPETRRRGIYAVQVYTAALEISGAFRDLETAVRSLSAADRLEGIEWSRAVLAFGLSDPRGIVEVAGFEVGGTGVEARPGTTVAEILPRGFHVPLGAVDVEGLQFRLPMVVRGSGGLEFLPLGETTNAVLRSSWPHPSFGGEVLPAAREVGGDGFSATWTIPLLNRSYPQAWTAGDAVDLNEITAGVRLFEPVALYDLVTRAVKYGLLFVVLTFLTLGLIELVLGVRLSLVQFLLVGVALAMFFLILVALAEHIGFTLAYILGSAVVVVMNTLYCAAILSRRGAAAVVAGVLTAIYGVLYTILEAEDFALLGGTALLVVALAVTMYLTRRLNEAPTP